MLASRNRMEYVEFRTIPHGGYCLNDQPIQKMSKFFNKFQDQYLKKNIGKCMKFSTTVTLDKFYKKIKNFITWLL